MNKKPHKINSITVWGIILALVLLFVFGIPLFINECYKQNTGYITVWTGADVLAFYGSVLGAMITAGSLVITIRFTKKQIERDSYLKTETEKWAKIETQFTEAIEKINPIVPLCETRKDCLVNPEGTVIVFQRYQLYCLSVVDQLKSRYSDLSQVESLLNAINAANEKINCACSDIADVCRNMIEVKESSNTTADQNVQAQLFDEQTKALAILTNLYRTDYSPLFEKQEKTFREIEKNIQNKADEMLHLGRKSNANA